MTEYKDFCEILFSGLGGRLRSPIVINKNTLKKITYFNVFYIKSKTYKCFFLHMYSQL